MSNRLHTIPACDGRTNGRTDILPRHSPRYAYVSRGKNCRRFRCRRIGVSPFWPYHFVAVWAFAVLVCRR